MNSCPLRELEREPEGDSGCPRSSSSYRWWLVAVVGVVGLVGCGPSRPTKRPSGRQMQQYQVNHVVEAFDNLEFLYRVDNQELNRRVIDELNRWIEVEKPTASWSQPELYNRLPAAATFPVERLGSKRFTLGDVQYLMDNRWFQLLSDWLANRPADPELLDWLSSQPGEVREPIAIANTLFDWTTRNIQLMSLLPQPDIRARVALISRSQGRPIDPNSMSPATVGALGPGFLFTPGDALKSGEGDFWVRSRVFIYLCRQQGIDAVMLAVADRLGSGQPIPWLPAILIGDQFYLFDARLGQPIRCDDGKGIATLQQVQADPTLLSRLDMGSKLKYPVTAKDLERTVVLVDASPRVGAWRMKALEPAIPGEYRMTLAVDIDDLAKRCRRVAGIEAVEPWRISVEAELFRLSLPELLKLSISAEDAERDSELAALRMYNFRRGMSDLILRGTTDLGRGRDMQLRGQFNSIAENAKTERQGAKELYMLSQLPDRLIAELGNVKFLKEKVALAEAALIERQKKMAELRAGPLPDDAVEPSSDDPRRRRLDSLFASMIRAEKESEAAWEQRLGQIQLLLANQKAYAIYWLGTVHLDSDRPDVAAEWLESRVISADRPSPFMAAAQINYARALEAQGKLEEAAKAFRADSSPQRHGSLLRAREIRLKLESGTKEESQESPDEDKTKSDEDKTKSDEDKTKSDEDKTKSDEDKTKSDEDKTKSDENKTKSDENKTKSDENKTKSDENKTKSDENKTKADENKTKSDEDNGATGEPESVDEEASPNDKSDGESAETAEESTDASAAQESGSADSNDDN